MTMDLFSLVVTIAILGLSGLILLMLLGYLFSPRAKNKIISTPYEKYLAWIGITAAVSTLGVLIYQFIYGLEVCELCWWQRIFMFPIEVIVFVALLYKEKAAHITTGILATIGAGFAGYHYWNHFQNLVLGKSVVLPCGQIGLVPSCSEFAFTVFGFVTIPLMALLAFLIIIILSFFAHKSA